MIKAQAQNVARNLQDTPANFMTPTIFAQVSVMPTYSYTLVCPSTLFFRFCKCVMCIHAILLLL